MADSKQDDVRGKSRKKLGRLAYSVDEVAEALGMGRTTVYDMAKAGKIPSIKIGNRRLIPLKALQDWIDENTEGDFEDAGEDVLQTEK